MTEKSHEKVVILDGGLSTELEAAGMKIQVGLHQRFSIASNCFLFLENHVFTLLFVTGRSTVECKTIAYKPQSCQGRTLQVEPWDDGFPNRKNNNKL